MNNKKQITLNIGLNVGNFEPTNQKGRTVEALETFFDKNLVTYRTDGGRYFGNKERNIIAVVNWESESIKLRLKAICILLNQDCIAYAYTDDNNNLVGDMAINPACDLDIIF